MITAGRDPDPRKRPRATRLWGARLEQIVLPVEGHAGACG